MRKKMKSPNTFKEVNGHHGQDAKSFDHVEFSMKMKCKFINIDWCPHIRAIVESRTGNLHALTPHFYQPLRPLIGFRKAGEIQPAQAYQGPVCLDSLPLLCTYE